MAPIGRHLKVSFYLRYAASEAKEGYKAVQGKRGLKITGWKPFLEFISAMPKSNFHFSVAQGWRSHSDQDRKLRAKDRAPETVLGSKSSRTSCHEDSLRSEFSQSQRDKTNMAESGRHFDPKNGGRGGSGPAETAANHELSHQSLVRTNRTVHPRVLSPCVCMSMFRINFIQPQHNRENSVLRWEILRLGRTYAPYSALIPRMWAETAGGRRNAH
eukprot:1363099-Amorphochlora_amoeboformis.AAC.1